MAEGSSRGRRSSTGLLLLAVVLLAVLGAGAGFSLGTLTRDSRVAAGGTPTGTDPTSTGTTGVGGSGTAAGQSANGTDTGGTDPGTDPPRCPRHTEEQAGVSPLTRIFYLRTAQSEVWICRFGDGTLYYQGHKGQPGGQLVEGSTALFLRTIEHEGSGYVATNTDPVSGHVTKYHVTRDRLVIESTWSGNQDVQPAV